MGIEPKRWREIKGVVQAALEQPPSKRRDFVERICGHDQDLRAEVSSLLAFEGEEFLEKPLLSEIGSAHLPDWLAAAEPGPEAERGDGDGDALLGARIGSYRVVETIGGGGMGDVYKATPASGSRPVVLKLLPVKFVSDPSRRRRFLREARAVSALDHPNVVRVLAVDEHEGRPLIVMEYLEGRTLRAMLSGTEGLGVERSLGLAVQFAAGLSEAHRRGIVHRDLKPGNIIVDRDDHLKILDFGLAKLLAPAEGTSTGLQDSIARLTLSGEIMGTVSYMAPEQARGQPVDRRSDIFAFACVVYEMLTGRKAFAGTSLAESVNALLFREPPPVRALEPGTPEALEELLSKALRKDPSERWESMSEIAQRLEALTSGRPPDRG